MNITYTGRHFDVDEDLQVYTEKRIRNLKKYFDGILDVHVIFTVEKFRHIAEVNIQANGFMLHGTKEAGDMKSSVDLVVEKLERQVLKHKGRLKNHRTKNKKSRNNIPAKAHDKFWNLDVLSGEDLDSSIEEPRVIQTTKFFVKPMSLDEAVLQLGLLDQDVLVFENDATNKINVLYVRKDGNYGLVETE